MVIFIPVLENKYAVHNNNYCNNYNECWIKFTALIGIFLFQEKEKIHYHEPCFALEVQLY